MALTADAALAMLGASKPRVTYQPSPQSSYRASAPRARFDEEPLFPTAGPKVVTKKKSPTDWLADLMSGFSSQLGRGAEANLQTGIAANQQVRQIAKAIPTALPQLGDAATQALASFSDMMNQGAEANLAVQQAALGGDTTPTTLPPREDTTWQDALTPYTDQNGNPIMDPESGFSGATPGTTPTTLPDTYLQQLKRWRMQMNAIAGITPTVLPDTWYGQLMRLYEQSLGQIQDEGGGDSGGGPTWWDGGGGGGGGYTPKNPEWWLGLVNWRI